MKKVLSVLFVLMLIFIIMPQISLAEVETTASSTRTTTLDLSDDALAALAAEDGVILDGGVYTNMAQGWSYDKATQTLTLSGAYIDAASTDATAYGIHLPADSKIVLADGTTNIVNGGDTDNGSSFAVFAEGALMIEDGGALTATGGNASEDSCGIYAYGGEISIGGGTINALGGDASNESIGIFANMDEDGNGGSINISSGNVSGTGGAAKGSSGISARGNNTNGGAQLIISGGEITALGGASSEYQAFGICANYGSVAISGDAVISATAGDSGSNSYGIYADVNTAEGDGNGKNENDGKITISGGEITAHGGDAGSSYGIFAVGAIAISECMVNATGGASTNVGTTGIASEAGGITINGAATTVNATGGTATLSPENEGEGGYANSMGIYAQGGDVLIDGNAVVNASGGASESECTCGIHLNKNGEDGSGGKLTITGDTQVTAVGGIIVNMQNAFGGAAFVISGNAGVDVSTADISEGENSGISMTNGYLMISENAAVTINTGNGKYTSSGIFLGIDSESAGENAGENDGKLIITGGTLEVYSATARNSRAIVAQSDIEISGGTVVAQSSEATEELSTGIFSSGEIIISGSADVTAQSGSGISLSAAVCADGCVTIDSALVVLSPEGGGVSADGLYISVAAGVDDDYATDVHIAAAPVESTAQQEQNTSAAIETERVSGDNANSSSWIVWLIAIAVAGLCIGGVIFFVKRKKRKQV